LIEAKGLARSFGDKIALAGLDLRVGPGEILGFLGPNGAGKTTTVKMLTAMLPPTAGSARVAGFDVETQPLEVKRRIGFVPESGAVYENLTGREYLELVASLHHLEMAAARPRMHEMLELFGILRDADLRMTQFSKGMKQKVLLAAAMLHNPDVLFLDEPLNGIDANAALIFKELLRRLADQGKAIFFSSHILEVVERVCTRIVIINEGRVVIEGTPQEIARDTRTPDLESAFNKLTGGRDAGQASADFLRAVGGS